MKLQRTLSSLVLVAVLLVAPWARGDGDSLVHKVKAGDTLALLAAEYYGDRNHQIFIMVANGMQHPRELVAGERLKIPTSREVTADVGKTFDDLASEYLGDKRRGRFLAQFNGIDPESTLAAGSVIQVPLQITHTAAGVETLDDIAAAYTKKKDGALLRDYNFLDKNTLEAGQSILVPIDNVRIRASKLPPADKQAQERSDKRRRMQEQANSALPSARTAWREGEYGTIKRELIGIDLDFLDADVAVEVGVLLGCAYVASGDADSAIAAFERVLDRKPKHTLDDYTYSPKIRDLWQKAVEQHSR